MNEEKLPIAIILAADLSVARAVHARSALASGSECISRALANPLSRQEKTGEKRRQTCLAGVAGLFGPGRASPLRGRPRRVNTSNGANQSATTASPTTLAAAPSTAAVILPVVAKS
jgi:hypothetical protein